MAKVKPKGWVLVKHLVPEDKGVVPQYAVPIDGGWGMTQGRDNGTGNNAYDDLVLTRFHDDGRETRQVLRGGHGDRTYSVDGHLVTLVKGVWSKITFGSPWSYKATARPARCPAPGLPGMQGEASAGGGKWFRLYGESIKGGSERDWEHRTAFLQVLDGTRVVKRIDLDKLARDERGLPIGGRYEPEGVCTAKIDGELWALVGFSVGRLGNTTMNVYGRPVADLI